MPANQFDLFDIATARKTDPDSSHLAIDKEQLIKQRTKVYLALKDHPMTTARELAAFTGLDRYMVSRRLPELEKLGHISRLKNDNMTSVIRECKIGHKMSCVWITVKQ